MLSLRPIYDHPAGHELRVYFERSEDAVVYTQVGEVQALDAKADATTRRPGRAGWLPISHEPPRDALVPF